MSEMSKITTDHLRRSAVVYVRQSSTTQVEHKPRVYRPAISTR